MLQISLPCLVFGSAETKVKFGGGTNAIMAPQIDYFTEVSDLRITIEHPRAKGGSAFLYNINSCIRYSELLYRNLVLNSIVN